VEIFGILEEFNYRFSSEDMNRRWTIFGGPKETMELVEQRKNVLEKEKVKFLEVMKVQQDEFKQTIENLERTIQNFHHHQNLKDHENIAKDVESINEQLSKYVEDSKKFNQQESLFEMETTDYNKINQMIREFTPYSNLWLTASNWYKNKVNWKNGEWDKLDAEAAERFVDDGLRTLSGVN
jgi:dynein heavy chain, axonemal